MKWKVLALACLAAAAAARNPDGTLGLIRTPNNGMPAMVTGGGSFDAVFEQEAPARLVSETGTSVDLEVEWTTMPGGRAQGRCTTPGDAQPGAYALEAGDDRIPRAVYVFDAFPESYRIAHVTDTHIGATAPNGPATEAFGRIVAAVNEARPAFALITGDLTENGDMEQFREFVEALDRCQVPTFVCAGNHDRQGLNYEAVFGPLTYAFRFGEDGYLGFDTKDFLIADELGPQDADLQVLRRGIKAARWSIGFTHRYDADMGMRSQVVLFVDNPLDSLLFGHYHRANKDKETKVPWGRTSITMTPAGMDGAFRFIEISPGEILPLEVVRAGP